MDGVKDLNRGVGTGAAGAYLLLFYSLPSLVSRSQTVYHPLPATRVEERVWGSVTDPFLHPRSGNGSVIDSAVLVPPENWWR